jgi:hypothetical protein
MNEEPQTCLASESDAAPHAEDTKHALSLGLFNTRLVPMNLDHPQQGVLGHIYVTKNKPLICRRK